MSSSSSNPFRRAQPTDPAESSAALVATGRASHVASLDLTSSPNQKSASTSSSPQRPSLPVQTPLSPPPPPPPPPPQPETDHDFTPSMPPNPFARTLATIDEPWPSSQSPERANKGSEPLLQDREDRAMPRASMDVHAFKNLLMTGKASVHVQGRPPQAKSSSLTLVDNSSSTDTSSTSRHSLSEPAHDAASETPRTSYEQSISELGDENTHLLQASQIHDREKPPPPKHRHGKAVPPHGPQIVSFADFSPSFASPSPSSVPILVSGASPTSPLGTDLNKPLPPPPRPSSRDSAYNDKDVLSPTRSSGTIEVSENAPPKKIAPTVPLARRTSRHGSVPVVARARSNTQTSNASARDDTETRSISESSNSNKAPPPPPPPPKRRSKVITSPQNYTADDDGGSLSLSRTSSLRSPPQVPAARNRSLSQLSSPSSTSVSSGMMSPPPPPPPRRSIHRQSSKGSIEMTSPLGSRRVSQEVGHSSFDGERLRGTTGSISKDRFHTEEAGKSEAEAEAGSPAPPQLPRRESTQVESQQTKDILADMEAFQREIDALKKKFEDAR